MSVVAQQLPYLEDLNLRYCYKISNQSVDALCASVPRLRTLNLSQCSKITDVAILRMVECMTVLRELRLWGCTKLTSAAVCAISTGMPSLTLVDIRSRDKFGAVIGGDTALQVLIQTYRSTLAKWENAGVAGVFKRPLLCSVVA